MSRASWSIFLLLIFCPRTLKSREETCLTLQLINCDLSLTHFLIQVSVAGHCPQFSLASHLSNGFVKQSGQLSIFPLSLLLIFEVVSQCFFWVVTSLEVHNYFYFISSCGCSFATVTRSSIPKLHGSFPACYLACTAQQWSNSVPRASVDSDKTHRTARHRKFGCCIKENNHTVWQNDIFRHVFCYKVFEFIFFSSKYGFYTLWEI